MVAAGVTGFLAAVSIVWLFREPLAVFALERRPEALANHQVLISEVLRHIENAAQAQRATIAEQRLDATMHWLKAQGFNIVVGAGDDPRPNKSNRLFVFTDYFCTACRSLDAQILFLLNGNPDLQLVFMPVGISGPESEHAARQALIASLAGSGEFSIMHEQLMTAGFPGQVTEKVPRPITGEEAAADAAIAREAARRLRALVRELDIRGLPALVYDGETFVGAQGLNKLKQVLG